MKRLGILISSLLLWAGSTYAKPLKVYILAGQSNMEGHAHVRTFDYIGEDPKTAPLLKEMLGPDGKPKVCDNVWISLYTGNKKSGEAHGKLAVGYGARGDFAKSADKIGPEYTFGIYMQKHVKEPILIIKTAWGGKSLHTDFRPPSAGPYKLPEETEKIWKKYPNGAHGVPKESDRQAWWDAKNKATGV